jgi:hypothetical protein
MDARAYAARLAAALRQANGRLNDDAAFYADVLDHFSAQ